MRIGKPIEKARVPFSLNKYYERLRPLINLAKHLSRQDFESRLLKKKLQTARHRPICNFDSDIHSYLLTKCLRCVISEFCYQEPPLYLTY